MERKLWLSESLLVFGNASFMYVLSLKMRKAYINMFGFLEVNILATNT
jgi:hypothetical protein